MSEARNGGFAIEIDRAGGRAVVVVRGEIDLSTAAAFRSALTTAIEGRGRLEVDMRDTTFMDSTGLAVLVAAHQRLGQAHEALVVREPPPIVRKLLELSGVAALVDIKSADDGYEVG